MNDTQMLAGSLSNDLFRVASLTYRGSMRSSARFHEEARKWAKQLRAKSLPDYVKKITEDILQDPQDSLDLEVAEKYLMYGILLQNYALHTNDNHD